MLGKKEELGERKSLSLIVTDSLLQGSRGGRKKKEEEGPHTQTYVHNTIVIKYYTESLKIILKKDLQAQQHKTLSATLKLQRTAKKQEAKYRGSVNRLLSITLRPPSELK